MSNEKVYDGGVWRLTYYKIDSETGDELCDEKGDVIEFIMPDEDCSHVTAWIDPDDLEELR
jgi:hypothetical protein